MMRIIYTLLLSICLTSLAWADGSRYASNSVLAEGKWVKIQVDSTSIYKLSYAELQKMGFSDPSKVSVHGYGGEPIDEDISKGYIDDLPSVAVYRGDDYILFYGKGPTKWEYSSTTYTFTHTNNPYSSYGYYFLTDGNTPRTMEKESLLDKAPVRITSFDEHLLHEKDLVSVYESGREFFGESFQTTLARSFTFNVPGITNEDAKVTMRFISKAITSGGGSVSLSIGDQSIINMTIPYSSSSESYAKANDAQRTSDWIGEKSQNVKMDVVYGQSNHQNVHLDYIRLHVKRELKPYGAYTFFRSLTAVDQNARFVIQDATQNTLVFDVTDCVNPKQMETELDGTELSFSIPQDVLREFVIVQTDKTFPVPTKIGEVTNQDLHALEQTDMIIIAPPAFTTQAERLAEEHRVRDDLSVKVIAPQDIYNEFSSGTPDASAYRRLMKMLYDRRTSDEDAPQYLLLFGDGVYDNRGITNNTEITNLFQQYGDVLLLTYQSQESLRETTYYFSYVTDDYFGFLDDSNNDKSIEYCVLDIGIGRIPVRTAQEAKEVVDKLISYMDNKDAGPWKNKVSFVADDGNTADNFTTRHMSDANTLADYIHTNNPEFLTNKIFFDTYKKDYSGANTTYPDVTKKIQQQLKSGLLIINYIGHGNTTSWSDERVLTQSDIIQSTYTNLPLWITATCDFTRFDHPTTSAGESVLLNKISGGMGLFTTTRPVYPDQNYKMNDQLIRHLFQKENGKRLTLGEVMKHTKQELNKDSQWLLNVNKLCFLLIGDPAMKLAYPDYQTKITRITANGEEISDDPTFRALDEVTIEGEIHMPDGSIANEFNGPLNPTIMDSKETIRTLNNNNSSTFEYTDYPNIMYTGKSTVTNGTFSFTFTVPKDISYSNNNGMINLYASDNQTGVEAQGAFLDFKVGGTNESAEEDNDGPEIRTMFLNDSTFIDGGKVNITPFFYARLWDKSGINISGSSVGHNLTLNILGQSSQTYNLNEYYESVDGSEKEGTVMFMIPELRVGKYTAEFVAWDVHNNSSRDTISFEVVEGLKPKIFQLLASPNPAREQVEFRLDHDRPETNMEVNIFVYDMAGRRVWQERTTGSSELFKSLVVTWDLNYSGGGRLRPGVYIYRAAISSHNSKEATKANKLIILAQ